MTNHPNRSIMLSQHESGKSWKEYSQERTDEELLSIIKSTNPKGRYGLGRVAAMDEWDRRHPVGAEQ